MAVQSTLETRLLSMPDHSPQSATQAQSLHGTPTPEPSSSSSPIFENRNLGSVSTPEYADVKYRRRWSDADGFDTVKCKIPRHLSGSLLRIRK